MTTAPMRAAPSRAIATAAEAREALKRLDATIGGLEDLFAQEDGFVRAGRLTEAARLASRKEELARAYLTDSQRLKDSLPRLRGELGHALDAAKARHAKFQARLQGSLTVLATAHAVSEAIVRGLSQELTRKAAPQVYGASGRPTGPSAAHARPLALSRTL